MSCYIEDEIDYEVFELTEENCDKSTEEWNAILASRSQNPLSDITPNKNVILKEIKSVPERNTVQKKGENKNRMRCYQRQPGYTVASRILVTQHFEGGIKRKNTDRPTNNAKRLNTDAPINTRKRHHSDRSESKRPATPSSHANPIVSSRNFSIRGAAVKASQQQRLKEEERKSKLPVQQRLRGVQKQEEANPKVSTKPPVRSRLQRREQVSPMEKKVENRKSSELIISHLNENTTFNDIKKLVDESNTVAKITYRNGEPASTLLFGSIDAAVAFRKKYNRSKVDDSYITIAFKK